MNQAQLTKIAHKLRLDPGKVEAVRLVIIGHMNSAQAEKAVYGRITSTISRIVKRVREEFYFCIDVSESKESEFRKDSNEVVQSETYQEKEVDGITKYRHKLGGRWGNWQVHPKHFNNQ